MKASKVIVVLFLLLFRLSACTESNDQPSSQGQCDGKGDDCKEDKRNKYSKTMVNCKVCLAAKSCTEVKKTGGQTQCICKENYTGENCKVKIKDLCDAKSCCAPKTECKVDPNDDLGFRCVCPDGKTGKFCGSKAPACDPNPCCKPKTRCVEDDDAIKGYRCTCPKGKIGAHCEFTGPCTSEPCLNGGTCEELGDAGSYMCACDKNYTGAYCQFDDPCASMPCLHGGNCTAVDISRDFTCKCPKGKTGNTCKDIDGCASNPCQNGGLCTSDPNGHVQCICDNGFSGDHCEKAVDCNICLTANSCTAETKEGQTQCVCKENYTGEHCKVEIKVTCSNHPCQNGGSCTTTKDSYNCSCKAGFYGKNCEIIEYSCTQDISTSFFGTSKIEDLVAPDKGKLYLPEEKPFCPVVQTILERDGCKRCDAKTGNCRQCCEEKKQKCDENCKRLANFCKLCHHDPNSGCKDACNGITVKICERDCTAEENICNQNCSQTDSHAGIKGQTPCPIVYTCKHWTEQKDKQCRAFKFPSGEIACSLVEDKTEELKKKDYHSYILYPRIHFHGKVQIDSATLNNVFDNFDAKTFASANTAITNENWNPSGSSNFRFADVTVSRVCHKDGLCVYRSHDDPVVGAPVKDQANGKVAAKIVDLDVEVQGRVSEIYGLSLDVGGFFKGEMERASFQSLWYKMIDEDDDDYGQGSRFQSVLNNVQFSEKTSLSRIAQHFQRRIGPNQKLSICFNIDMMGEHHYSNFSFGRIVGSIGLSGEKAPPFFSYGRLLRHLPATSKLSYAPFTVDEDRIFIDLGNTLAIGRDGFVLKSVGNLLLGVYKGKENDPSDTGKDNPTCLDEILWIGRVYYNEYGGYIFTSGITVVDIPGFFKEKLKKQFVLARIDDSQACEEILLAENKEGINVRPLSHFVYRAQYQEIIMGNLFVTIFGEMPEKGKKIDLKLETSNSIIRGHTLKPTQPFGLFEDNAGVYNYYFYAKVNTNKSRKFIDGQIYALQYTFRGYPLNPNRNEAMNTAIFIHVYQKFINEDGTQWLEDIMPIFQVYANLFPVMSSFVDLGDYNSVVKKKCHILTAMSLDFQDPQFMPVTRDLSPKKTEMILRWLDEDKPEFGLNHETKLSKQLLIDILQIALQLEHSTIPIYLNGYLSIKPWQNEEVKDMLLKIIVDEMFHFAQVANIINGLGGRPYILGKTFIPSFPSHLPGGCRPNMIASIDKISPQQIHDVYMEIEEPTHVLKEHELVALINKISNAHLRTLLKSSTGEIDPGDCKDALRLFPLPNKKLTETNHETIGELYMCVVYILGQLSICGKKNIFTGTTRQLKWADKERLREVKAYDEALEAMKMIVDQGEGASAYNPLQQNVDSSELSHYFKFSSMFHGRQITTFNVTNEKVYNNNKEECHENYAYAGDKIAFFETGVWPVIRNPRMSKYKKGSMAYKNAEAFNDVYRTLLETMQSVFDGNIDRFDDSFGLMKSLIIYGSRVVQTPIDEDGDPNVGPNAGPTYFN